MSKIIQAMEALGYKVSNESMVKHLKNLNAAKIKTEDLDDFKNLLVLCGEPDSLELINKHTIFKRL